MGGCIFDPQSTCADTIDKDYAGDTITFVGPDSTVFVPWGNLPDPYEVSGPVPMWAKAGEAVTVSAPGNVIPAFSIDALTPPANIDPTWSSDTIEPGVDLTVTWTPTIGGGYAAVTVTNTSGGFPVYQVSCLFPMDAGKGVIPAAPLASLQPGPALGAVTPTRTTTARAGAWPLQVELDGAFVFAPLTVK